jgi:hypothetical protein
MSGINCSDTESGEFWYWYGKRKIGTFQPLSEGSTLTLFFEKAPDLLAISGSSADTADDVELEVWPEWEEAMMEWIVSKALLRPGGDAKMAVLADRNYLRARKEAASNIDRDVTALGHGYPQE